MSGQTDTDQQYSPEIKELAQRVHAHFQAGYDRWDGDDLRRLAAASLMEEDVCDDPERFDSLEEGEAMWVFTQAGKNLLAAMDAEERG